MTGEQFKNPTDQPNKKKKKKEKGNFFTSLLVVNLPNIALYSFSP